MSEEEEQEHSKRGPSGAHRWRPCPASVREEEGLPDTAGIFAAEGTAFHAFAADCVELGIDAKHLIGARHDVPGFGTFVMDETMANNMQYGLDILTAYIEEPGTEFWVEEKVSLEKRVGDGEFGTTDFCAINVWQGWMVTADWKYGAGVPVSPVDNDQGILYTLGAWDAWGAERFAGIDPVDVEVIIIIEQPRAPGGGGVWVTNMAHLLEVAVDIRRDADATLDPDAPHNPGPKQCTFCKAARFNTCLPRAEFMLDHMGLKFDELEDDFEYGIPTEVKARRVLSPEARTQLIKTKPMIESFLKSLHDEALADLEHGDPAPGLKRVHGRAGHTKWRDPAKAAILLERELFDRAYKRTILSPTQARDTIGRNRYEQMLARHAVAGTPSVVLVSEEHKAPALSSVHDKYDSISGSDDDTLI